MAVALLAAVVVADLGWNNGPNESTALPPSTYDVLRADTANPTIALIRERLKPSPGQPDRRDRVELAGIDFHWPNASMVHRFDHTLGYNPVHLDAYTRATGAQDHVALPSQRTFSPLFPSYRSLLADMLGLRIVATQIPVNEMDPTLGQTISFPSPARPTPSSTRTRAPCPASSSPRAPRAPTSRPSSPPAAGRPASIRAARSCWRASRVSPAAQPRRAPAGLPSPATTPPPSPSTSSRPTAAGWC